MNRYRVEWFHLKCGDRVNGSALVVAHTAADAETQAIVRLRGLGAELTRIEPAPPLGQWTCECGITWSAGAGPACHGCGKLAVPMWLEPAP